MMACLVAGRRSNASPRGLSTTKALNQLLPRCPINPALSPYHTKKKKKRNKFQAVVTYPRTYPSSAFHLQPCPLPGPSFMQCHQSWRGRRRRMWKHFARTKDKAKPNPERNPHHNNFPTLLSRSARTPNGGPDTGGQEASTRQERKKK